MAKSDIQIVNDAFVQFGGQIFRENLLDWDFSSDGIQMRTNVNAPQTLTKLSSTGKPRPYRSADDFAGNGAKYTDRIITAYQSKWDWEFDNEDFRNTYLANKALQEKSLFAAALDFLIDKYKEYLKTESFYEGVRDVAGDEPVDIADGWGTIIAAEITGGGLTPIVTGVIDSTNAVAKIEAFAKNASIPKWIRKKGAPIYCSFDTFDDYCTNYRAVNTYGFKASETGQYKLDNLNFYLLPVDWMGNSGRLALSVKENFVFGTDVDRVGVFTTIHLNIIQTRLMMPVGYQIQDLAAIFVNDQA